ncbi:hypothetical protein pb186bvf_016254 [Paramecium bursaria]
MNSEQKLVLLIMKDDDINTLQATCQILLQKQFTIIVLTKNLSQQKMKYHELQNQIRTYQSQHKQSTQSLENCTNEFQDQSLFNNQENKLLQDGNMDMEKVDGQILNNNEPKNNMMHLCNSKVDWSKEIQQDNVKIIKYFRSHPKYIIGIAKDNEKSLKYGRAATQKREKMTDKYEQLLMIQLKNSEPIQSQLLEQEQNQQIEFITDQLKNNNIEQNIGLDDKLLIYNQVTITKQAQQEQITTSFQSLSQILKQEMQTIKSDDQQFIWYQSNQIEYFKQSFINLSNYKIKENIQENMQENMKENTYENTKSLQLIILQVLTEKQQIIDELEQELHKWQQMVSNKEKELKEIKSHKLPNKKKTSILHQESQIGKKGGLKQNKIRKDKNLKSHSSPSLLINNPLLGLQNTNEEIQNKKKVKFLV